MGAVKVDIEKGTREYTQKYALNDKAGVAALLRDRHRIAARRFHAGDYAASDILIDLHSAIESAGLTERQAEAVAWVYGADLTQTKAAEIMGISQKNVNEYLTEACERVASVYTRWNYGQIAVNYVDETTEGCEAIDAI